MREEGGLTEVPLPKLFCLSFPEGIRVSLAAATLSKVSIPFCSYSLGLFSFLP